MNPYDDLQAEHGRLLDRREAGEDPEVFLAEVRAYIERVKAAAEQVPDPRDRSQLRANLRFWASFVYDRTGVYPDTDMRPAAQPAVSPPAPPKVEMPTTMRPADQPVVAPPAPAKVEMPVGAAPSRPVAGAQMPADAAPRPSPEPKARSRFRPAALIGLFALLGLVVVMVILVGIGMLTGGPQSGFPDSTRVTQPTGMDLAATLTAQAGLVITRHPIIPPQFEPYLLTTVGLLPNSSDCPGHSLSVSIQNPAPFAGLNLPPASVRITRAGSGDVAASGELSFSGRPLDLCLPPAKQELYLLSVDHPALIFESLVLRFGQGEEAGGRQASYALEASNPDMLEDWLAKAATQPPGDLSLNWFLLTWGPEPFADRWVAELALQAGGGDGNYIFFTKDSRLEEPRLFLGEPACQRSQIEIGVTSGGRSFRRYFLLRPAGCYDELPAP